jgi:hypothetical protein
MNVATLRVEGPANRLAEMKQLLGIAADAEWHAGEKRRDGSARELSGFNATISDAETMAALTSHLRAFLNQCVAAGVTFPWRGVTGEVDIGFCVGGSDRYFGGFRLPSEDVRCLAASGLSLVATAYPISDEANAT